MIKTEIPDVKSEICIESIEGVIAAKKAGADRVELCTSLLEGGLTPSFGMVKRAIEVSGAVKVMAMVRPRGGDFCYSGHEFNAMMDDVVAFKQLGVDGFVFGILEQDGGIDMVRTSKLIEICKPVSVTFHRAFDMAKDPLSALEMLISMGVDRLLTSGQAPGVIEGAPLIRKLVENANGRLIIMPGGDITVDNVERLIDETGVSEIHYAALELNEGPMSFRNSKVFMGGALRPPEYQRTITSVQGISRVINALHLRRQSD